MRLGANAVTLPVLEIVSVAPIGDVDASAARLLKLLADGTRRRIVLMLMRGETCNCELAEQLGLAENLISHHIRQLREAGFVCERRDERDARWVYYTLDRDALERAWITLEAAFNPAHLGVRTATCGPSRPAGRVEEVPRG